MYVAEKILPVLKIDSIRERKKSNSNVEPIVERARGRCIWKFNLDFAKR